MDKEEGPEYSSDEETNSENENESVENENEEEEIEYNDGDDDVAEQKDGDEASDEEEIDDDDNSESGNEEKLKKIAQSGGSLEYQSDEDDDDYQSPYLQKFNAEINKNYLLDFHPECAVNNYEEISVLTQVIRDRANNIIDDLHKTIPFLTKYERTRIIGQRAKQINSGAKAFVKVPENVIDGYLVAELELMQKRIPFIIRRPTPGGGCEYWNLKDLEIVSF
jgi:DNA-directed RNA polymerase subunit K/omega